LSRKTLKTHYLGRKVIFPAVWSVWNAYQTPQLICLVEVTAFFLLCLASFEKKVLRHNAPQFFVVKERSVSEISAKFSAHFHPDCVASIAQHITKSQEKNECGSGKRALTQSSPVSERFQT